MKKLLALTLALAMALSLGVTAVAKDTPIPEGAKVSGKSTCARTASSFTTCGEITMRTKSPRPRKST